MSGKGLGGLFARLSTYVRPLLKTALKAAKPLAKKTLKQLGKHGAEVASATLNDVVSNNMSLKEAAKKNVRQGMSKAKKTATRGVKKAVKASAKNVMKDINRKKQIGSGPLKKRKKAFKKKASKKKKKKKPYRGIFQ